MAWRVGARRAFLLLLPVSLPIWLVGLAVLALAITVRACYRPIGRFWSAPPKVWNGSGYRGSRPEKLELRVVSIERPPDTAKSIAS